MQYTNSNDTSVMKQYFDISKMSKYGYSLLALHPIHNRVLKIPDVPLHWPVDSDLTWAGLGDHKESVITKIEIYIRSQSK